MAGRERCVRTHVCTWCSCGFSSAKRASHESCIDDSADDFPSSCAHQSLRFTLETHNTHFSDVAVLELAGLLLPRRFFSSIQSFVVITMMSPFLPGARGSSPCGLCVPLPSVQFFLLWMVLSFRGTVVFFVSVFTKYFFSVLERIGLLRVAFFATIGHGPAAVCVL